MDNLLVRAILIATAASSLIACSGEIIPEDATSPEKAKVVHLELEKQQVRRYNCDGDVVSDRVEVMKAPTELMELHPTSSRWSYDTIVSSSFTNLRTRSTASYVISKVKFYIDAGNGALNMFVRPGINKINYRFDFSDGSEERGVRYIDVYYSETMRTGIRQEHPTECPY